MEPEEFTDDPEGDDRGLMTEEMKEAAEFVLAGPPMAPPMQRWEEPDAGG